MRVLHVIPYLSTRYGGPITILRSMVAEQVKLGIDVTVVSTRADGNVDFSPSLDCEYYMSDTDVVLFSRTGVGRSFYFSLALGRWLREKISSYDIIHIHGVFTYPATIAMMAAREVNVPYVVSPHGMLDQWCMKRRAWKKWPYYALVEQRNLVRAQSILAASRFEDQQLRKLGHTKVSVVPFGIAIANDYCELDNTSHSAILRVVCVARLDALKGLEVLIDALGILSKRGIDTALDIVGDGPSAYRLQLFQQAQNLNVSVCFAGHLRAEEVRKRLRGADIFVLPSFHESFSFALAEAMSAALPVITTDQVGMAESIVQRNCGSVVPVGNPSLLADAIASYQDPIHRHAAGQRARKNIVENFQIGDFIVRLQSCYQQAIKSRG